MQNDQQPTINEQKIKASNNSLDPPEWKLGGFKDAG